MKLNNSEFKVFKELEKLDKEGKLSGEKRVLFEKLKAKKASNALSWWSKYPELLKDSVNVAFNYLAGAPMYGFGTPTNAYYQPGIIRIPYIQTCGVNNSKDSPLNLQMYQLWLDMHRKYRGIGAYQMADLAIAILAIIDVFGELAAAERIYALANTYKAGNRNVPYTIAQAMGVDLDNIVQNFADFRYSLNLLNRRVKSLCLPKGLSMLENRVTLNTGVFKDADNDRSAIFFWDTQFHMIYEAATYTTGGSIKYLPHSTNTAGKRTAGSIIADLTASIDALLLDDDIARICSDILAAYGENGIETSAEIPEDYSLVIAHSDERSLQFHNIIWVNTNASLNLPVINKFSATIYAEVSGLAYPTTHYMDIYQEDNVVYTQYLLGSTTIVADSNGQPFPDVTGSGLQLVSGQTVFDCWKEDPTPEDVMCGTRFKIYVTDRTHVSGGNTYKAQQVDACGSEICLNPTIVTKQSGVFAVNAVTRQWYNDANYSLLVPDLMTKFDWHPCVYHYGGTYSPHGNAPTNIFGDLDNFVFLSLNTLQKLHEVAMLSGFKLDLSVVQ